MSDKKNCVCHFCRKSGNRKRVAEVIFYSCSLCRKTYCEQCINENPNIKPDEFGCLVCQKLCCCIKKCKGDHKCCFNLRRNKNRVNKKHIETRLFKLVEAAEVEENL